MSSLEHCDGGGGDGGGLEEGELERGEGKLVKSGEMIRICGI